MAVDKSLGLPEKVGYTIYNIFVVNREYSVHCHGLVHGLPINRKPIGSNGLSRRPSRPVRWVNLLLLAAFASACWTKSAVSADIDYHWGGDLDAKQGELCSSAGEAS